MKSKIETMTSAEIRAEKIKKYGSIEAANAHMKAVIKAAPEFDIEDIPELKGFVPGKPILGFKAFNEYINRGGRPKAEDPRVNISIRIPLSYASIMRNTGAGWQTRMGEFIIDGINKNDKRLVPA